MLNYNHLKSILFNFEPETAHHIAEVGLKSMQSISPLYNYFVERNFVNNSLLRQNILGMEFANPVGLGAGFDKNATVTKSMKGLGFGYTEVGTITPKPQDGNAKPRLFRFPQSESLQNAMGFNNDGKDAILNRIKSIYPFDIPIGANIGKNKTTSQDDALSDYRVLIETFKDYSDYLVINISSPNTPNLRDLQNESFIKELFDMSQTLTNKPIFLKIAPDMDSDVAINLCKTAVNSGASGIIATNTTIDYSLLDNPKDFGGISGKVLNDKSYKIFCDISKELFGETILISVGGIDSAQSAYSRIKAGASLVQIYSSLIFKGPSLVRDINLGLIELLERDGFSHISQAVGSDLG
jgi:dihydroorotate dehydrogenase